MTPDENIGYYWFDPFYLNDLSSKNLKKMYIFIFFGLWNQQLELFVLKRIFF
jgi:hypothetical protein